MMVIVDGEGIFQSQRRPAQVEPDNRLFLKIVSSRFFSLGLPDNSKLEPFTLVRNSFDWE